MSEAGVFMTSTLSQRWAVIKKFSNSSGQSNNLDASVNIVMTPLDKPETLLTTAKYLVENGVTLIRGFTWEGLAINEKT